MSDASRSGAERESADESPNLVQRLRGWLAPGNGDTGSVREALEELIEEQPEADAAIDEHERALLSNVLKQRDVTAKEIMVPRADIVAVESGAEIADAIKLMVDEGHSRLPVYRDSLDDVIGMVHIKDLAAYSLSNGGDGGEHATLTKMMRRMLYIAPAARVLDVLLEMRLRRSHMAVVVDEYGGIDGLLTIEDVVEQIVGDIADEHDEEDEPELVENSDGTVIADARMELDDFETRFGKVFSVDEHDEADTLGGLVFSLAGHVPSRGELIAHPSGLEFEIVDADPRRIRRVKLRNLPLPPAADD